MKNRIFAALRADHFFLCLLALVFNIDANIENHYKKLQKTIQVSAPKHIDYVYVINLDTRIERWIESLKQLVPYDIVPERFPAIYGWDLTPSVLQDIGLKFEEGMWIGREHVMVFPQEQKGQPHLLDLSEKWHGKACFSGWTVKGTIGCTLSHLSVLKDAFDAGYQTIWVLEDDFKIVENPHLLSERIEELDRLLGPDGWDVLYTDFNYLLADPTRALLEDIPFLWRPDMPHRDLTYMAIHVPLNSHFVTIGSRNRAHSIIYRRSGIQKIMDFYHSHDNFLPYDVEIALIPGMNMFTLTEPIVTVYEVTSDTRHKYF